MQILSEQLPKDIIDAAQDFCGEALRFVPLAGLSGSPVVRIIGPNASVVAKGGISLRELFFYEEAALRLGLESHAPKLIYACKVEKLAWILLEDIPLMLPKDNWQNNADLFKVLRQLHSHDVKNIKIPDPFVPVWTREMNNKAFAVLNCKDDPYIESRFNDLAAENQSLFELTCIISGDPNPTNWGLRRDGSLCLFDWGRFGYGTPAIDLGIAIQTFDTSPIYRQMAEEYLRAQSQRHDHPSKVVAKLEREIKIARLWIIIDFLCMVADGSAKIDKDRWPAYEKYFAEQMQRMPDFLRSLE